MIYSILAIFVPGFWELLIVLLLVIVFVGIPIALIIWFLKLLTKQKNENVKLRLEVGKLADELEKVRKGGKSHNDLEKKSE